MNVKLAQTAGFCFGVKRAVDLVNEQIATGKKPIYTYGPIIHNEQVVADFERQGVRQIPEGDDLLSIEPGTVIIRSHGVSRKVREQLESKGFEIVDATCPFVLKIHRTVEKYSQEGYFILIIGDPEHAEVQGIIGWISGERYMVIRNEEDAHNFSLEPGEKVCIVSQTTHNFNKFQELVEIIQQKGYDVIAMNTICNATEERQKEAATIAGMVDAMIVIGGRNSSNSQKLFDICSAQCANTYFIQTKEDLSMSALQSFDCIGITAGASTPNYIIQEVQRECLK
ncbi:MAG: 4-hydroxy-3-methylbut-2-enyl diphosphate reductase [Lachnospiraceae bacterium]|nr:4-hydroxy-3-methylbut-2-enyl diphosphate reductase [Lachnospiraceae bacterium]